MLGTKFEKPLTDYKAYAECAKWCNENNATIVDMGEYYMCVEIPAHVPTAEEIQQQLTAAVQNWMDTTVQQRGYDNIHTACTYANSTDHIFAAEGLACVKWRDSVWRKCYDILAEYQAGAREVPTVEELLTELPALEW